MGKKFNDTVLEIKKKIEREHGVHHYLTGGRSGGSAEFGFWRNGKHALTLFIDGEDLWDEQRLRELYLTPLYKKGNVAVKVVELTCTDCNYPMIAEFKKGIWIYCHCDKCKKRVKVVVHLTIQGVYE